MSMRPSGRAWGSEGHLNTQGEPRMRKPSCDVRSEGVRVLDPTVLENIATFPVMGRLNDL